MFGKFMNNYYYGKAGKGDYTPEDLPKNRWQLFLEMLRVRMSALCRMNLVYMIAWIPTIVVIASLLTSVISTLNAPTSMEAAYADILAAQQSGTGVAEDGTVTITDEQQGTTVYTPEMIEQIASFNALSDTEVAVMQVDNMQSELLKALLLLIPAIFITGPWTAGVAYVTRNWARDEHAFIWSDMKDAMKENWKIALILSGITSVVPFLAYMCWQFYGELAAENWVMAIPQAFTLMVAVVWMLAVTYAYPMLVTYKMNFKTILRNSLLMAVGRLPMSVGIRLLHCVPVALGVALTVLIGSLWVPVAVFAYYLLIGFTLSRFVTASFTNAQFDKFINNRIEGAQVNRGLAEDDDEDYEEEEEERELKPWENGYASQDK